MILPLLLFRYHFTGFYWILLDENIFSVFSVFFALAALCLRFSLVPLCGEKEMNF